MFSSFFHFGLYPTPLISYIAVPLFFYCASNNKPTVRTSLDYYTLLNTSQYPDVLLPIRVISPSRLSSTILFFIVLSESFSTSLNCPMVIYGSCIIASNVLWAIFGQSLGNISFILPHITQ